MIEYVFLDLDDTILDFGKQERWAIVRTLMDFGIEPTEDVIARYVAHSVHCWRAMERGELPRSEVRVLRFRRIRYYQTFQQGSGEVLPQVHRKELRNPS